MLTVLWLQSNWSRPPIVESRDFHPLDFFMCFQATAVWIIWRVSQLRLLNTTLFLCPAPLFKNSCLRDRGRRLRIECSVYNSLFLSDVMAMMLHATIYFSLCVSGVCEVGGERNPFLSWCHSTPCTKFYSIQMGFRVTIEVQGWMSNFVIE